MGQSISLVAEIFPGDRTRCFTVAMFSKRTHMPNRNPEGHCPTPEVWVGISEKVGKPCGHSSLPDNCAPSVFSNIEVCQGSNSQLPLTSHTWAVLCSICNSSTISGATSIVLQHHPPTIKLANLQSPKFELGASLPSVYEPFLAPPSDSYSNSSTTRFVLYPSYFLLPEYP